MLGNSVLVSSGEIGEKVYFGVAVERDHPKMLRAGSKHQISLFVVVGVSYSDDLGGPSGLMGL